MKTKKVRIETHRTYLICEKCLKGYMNYNTENPYATQLTAPRRYQHKCTRCSVEQWFTDGMYPITEEVEVNTRIRKV